MKFLQYLLASSALFGLLVQMSASASEINIDEINNYVQNKSSYKKGFSSKTFDNQEFIKTKNVIKGIKEPINEFEAGSFSETTTASFSADFLLGAVDGVAAEDALNAVYGFQIDLSTSFTGEDSLDISIDAGNGGARLTQLDLNDFGTDDALGVDGISYTFPLGDKISVMVGNDVPGSSLYSTACVYGGPTKSLDDCGNAYSAMDASEATALSASFDIGNGFAAAVGYEGEGDTASGLMTKEGTDTYGAQLSYAADQYAASVTYANYDTSTTDTTYWGLNGYWTPAETGTAVPSISVGYEVGNPNNTSVDTSHYFIGAQWDEIGPGTFGVAMGTKEHTADTAVEYLEYEAFYSYPINDGMTLTPVIFVRETAEGTDDETGMAVKTSFSF